MISQVFLLFFFVKSGFAIVIPGFSVKAGFAIVIPGFSLLNMVLH